MKHIARPAAISGRLAAPASKSVAQRAIAIASMAGGRSVVEHPGTCDDVLAAIGVCRSLGAVIGEKGDTLLIDGGIRPPAQPLHCGESGLGIRMFSGLAASFDTEVTLTGTGSLMKRPMHMIESSLQAVGVHCSTTNGRLPLTIRGPIKSGTAIVDGSQGSQTLTGLLIASPTAPGDVVLHVSDLKSKEYIDITIRVMDSFGVEVTNHNYEIFTIRGGQHYRPAHFRVEGDWSGAAFLLVAGAVAGNIRVDNLDPVSAQPDRRILEALHAAGASISLEAGYVEVKNNPLHGFRFDATHCPDLFPPLAALAANCIGESRITGVSRLRSKESDRAATLMETFTRLGIGITVEGETMIIKGGRIQKGQIDSFGDHRIAMAGTVAALNATGPVTINQAEAVNKSYPGFYKNIETLAI